MTRGKTSNSGYPNINRLRASALNFVLFLLNAQRDFAAFINEEKGCKQNQNGHFIISSNLKEPDSTN